MTKTLFSAIAIAAACAMTFASAPASAQLVTANDQPAEFPPPSYTGRQYVDSTGCVYVRAGFDGAVSWVPRISRSRTKLCGFTPTSVSRTELPVIADAPGTPPPTDAPERVVVRQAPLAAVPGAARVVVSAPRVVVSAPAPRVVATAPARIVASAPVIVAPAPQVRVATTASARTVRGTCPGASAVSVQYINPGARCGPQAEHPGGGAPLLSGGGGTVIGGGATLITSLPYVTPAPVAVPPGYREAWTDGRLNPNRGKQTLSGALQTALIWTQEVPRRLVDNSTGRDVTRENNYLLYPYTDYARQKQDLAGGQHIVVRTAAGQRMVVLKSQLAVSKTTGQTVLRSQGTPTYSTKSVRAPATQVARPAKPAAARAAPHAVSGRFVQVGSFGVAANAQSTIARLQGAGLPVRVGNVTRGGKTLQVVMAGPFADGAQAANALSIVRRAGFGDAYVRN